MLPNLNDRKPGTFARLARARRLYRTIVEHLTGPGAVVVVTTMTRSTTYKDASWFKQQGGSVYVKRGHNWDCIDYAKVQFGRMA